MKHLEQEKKFTNPGAIDIRPLGEQIFSKIWAAFLEDVEVCVSL